MNTDVIVILIVLAVVGSLAIWWAVSEKRALDRKQRESFDKFEVFERGPDDFGVLRNGEDIGVSCDSADTAADIIEGQRKQ